LLHFVGYLHRCTKMMHGQTDIKFTLYLIRCDVFFYVIMPTRIHVHNMSGI